MLVVVAVCCCFMCLEPKPVLHLFEAPSLHSPSRFRPYILSELPDGFLGWFSFSLFFVGHHQIPSAMNKTFLGICASHSFPDLSIIQGFHLYSRSDWIAECLCSALLLVGYVGNPKVEPSGLSCLLFLLTLASQCILLAWVRDAAPP